MAQVSVYFLSSLIKVEFCDKIIFCHFSRKKKCCEYIFEVPYLVRLMSKYNQCFYGEVNKIILR